MYRTIDTVLWSDPKVRALTPNAKLLFVYLITNSHTHLSGIYYLPSALMAFETGLSEREVRYGIDTLSIPYLAQFDAKTQVVWVVNMFRYQGSGEKNVRAAAEQLAKLHNSFLIPKFLQHYSELQIPYRYPIDTLSAQEQEQEQEQKTTQGSASRRGGAFVVPSLEEVSAYCTERRNGIDAEEFVAYYSARGWQMTNGKQMKDWKSAIVTWEKRRNGQPTKPTVVLKDRFPDR